MQGFQWVECSEQEIELLEEVGKELGVPLVDLKDVVKVTVKRRENGLCVKTDGDTALLEYAQKAELGRAFGLLVQQLSKKGKGSWEEHPVFDSMTFMQDNSRNGVLSTKSVKRMLRQLALMGYNCMQLYTEDTYELEDYPFFGYMRGRYSKQELKELNLYADVLGIELVPCIQTLAHLNAIFHWNCFQPVRDTGDILLCEEEKTYELIEAMVKTCAECFHSRRINIGMDEAEMLGRGRFLDKFSFQQRFDIMTKHLKRVLSICEKYGFEAMMWSDMFFKMLSGGKYHATDITISDDIRKQIPDNVSLIYWDYYSRDKEKYDGMLSKHKEMSDRIMFAGGAWRWNGYAPLLHHSLLCNSLALRSCVENGIRDVIVTAWGDNGAECSTFCVGPILQQYAEFCYTGDVSESHLAERLKVCTGMNFHDFMLLDLPNLTPDNPSPGRVSVGPAKYLLYQDILMGLYDLHIDPDTYPLHYETCRKLLGEAAQRAGEYEYIFRTLECLSDVLGLKCTLGIELKKAYDSRDQETLRQIGIKCEKLLGKVEAFHGLVSRQWYTENKPFGMDILDIRLGGLKERIRRADWTIQAYLNGELQVIDELEQERLLLDERENLPYRTLPLYHNNWGEMISACNI